MPELPEVETVVRALAPVLTGRRITGVEVRSRASVAGPPQSLRNVAGRRVERVWRRGKFILLDLSGGYGLAIHLRMTGWLGVAPGFAPTRKSDPYLRVVFKLDGQGGGEGRALLFRDIRKFGRIWPGPRQSLLSRRELAGLGPEPLEIGRAEFVRRLRRRGGRLKTLLLDQGFLAGLGNIYADEALYDARLHPLLPARAVCAPAAARLWRAIRRVLRRALAAGGTTLRDYLHPDGSPGYFQLKLRAYGREGKPCGRCGALIRRIEVGQRGAWFCPRCQRAGRG